MSLSGSLIAWAKLEGASTGRGAVRASSDQRCGVPRGARGRAVHRVFEHGHASRRSSPSSLRLALIFGVLMTMPIGGADMPVVISLYNAFTGLAVGFEGYVLQNPALMIAGMVVGSAGTLLTLLMAQGDEPQRSPTSSSAISAATGDEQQGEIKGAMKPAEAGDAAVNMRYASKVIIAPGYGLAVAQAQHKLYEFVKLLMDAGVEVKFAIHPVAGRMPGHMNVLLAEAGVPYDMIYDLEDINDEFKEADVADRHRRQRHGEPGGAHQQVIADLRHADPERGPGQAGVRDQARPGQRLFGRGERAVLRRQHATWFTATRRR